MPIYEYKCSNCGKRTELLARSSKNARMKCPDCGSVMQKQLSVFAPSFRAGESKKCLGCSDNACPHAGS